MTTSTITRGCSDSLLTTAPLRLVDIWAFGIRFRIFYNIFFSISLPLSIAKQCISLVISAALSLNLSILFWKEATERLRLDVDSCWAIFLKENPVRVFMFFSDRTFSAWLYSSFAKCTSASCLNFLLATTSLLRNDILSRSNAQSLVPVLFSCNLLWTAPDILAYLLSAFLGLFLIRPRVPLLPMDLGMNEVVWEWKILLFLPCCVQVQEEWQLLHFWDYRHVNLFGQQEGGSVWPQPCPLHVSLANIWESIIGVKQWIYTIVFS